MPKNYIYTKALKMWGAMIRRTIIWYCLFVVLVNFSLIGCAGGNRNILNVVQKPTEDELLQDWKEYTVFHRRNQAFVNQALVYKIKNDSKIVLNNRWIEVTSENMMKDTQISSTASVKEIISKNDKLFGYLVHRSRDRPWAGIVDEDTVKLSYWQYNR